MGTIFLIFSLLFTLGISWLNAHAAGAENAQSKLEGGFSRLLFWSTAAMSAIGFSSLFMFASLATLSLFLPTESLPTFTKLTSSLWYVLVLVPLLGSGMVITMHSWLAWYREKTVLNSLIAGYNTYAQVKNSWGAVNLLGDALEAVSKPFEALWSGTSGDDDSGSVVVRISGTIVALAMIVVASSLFAGVVTTMNIIGKYPK
jgi:hypothetical protein